MALPSLVIIGTGWSGYTLADRLQNSKYNITIISPEPKSPYTPLLASAACGLFDFSLAEDSIRRKSKKLKYIKATVTKINFEKKACICSPAFESLASQSFDVTYDKLIIAPGCSNQTFNTPGVAEHALFVRNVRDARAVRQRLHDILEIASLPTMTEKEQRDLLHFVVVGGGPTGVEITAELYDLVHNDLTGLYPDLAGKASLAIHDVGKHILSAFDVKLSEYALDSFTKRDVVIKSGSHIEKVEADALYTKEDGRIPYGMLIWATGNKQVPLVDTLDVLKSGRLPRIQTDNYLRVYWPDMSLIDSVYALGDAADIKGGELPTTAEVACQKAQYLCKVFNANFRGPFTYDQRAIVAYVGQHDGVIMGSKDWSGEKAWLAWRSKNLLWARSLRKRIMITISWALNWIFGKDVARI